MRIIYTQFSGLAGLLAFLNQIWSLAPLERTILIGFGTGLGVYFLLLVSDLTINRILAHTPPALAKQSAGARDSDAEAKDKPQAKAA